MNFTGQAVAVIHRGTTRTHRRRTALSYSPCMLTPEMTSQLRVLKEHLVKLEAAHARAVNHQGTIVKGRLEAVELLARGGESAHMIASIAGKIRSLEAGL